MRRSAALCVVVSGLVGTGFGRAAQDPGGQGATSAPAAGALAESQPGTVDLSTLPTDQLLDGAERLLSRRRVQDAAQIVNMALAREERNARALALLGEINEIAGDSYAARQQYERVLQIEPSNFRATANLGRWYLNTRIYRQAVGYLERAEKLAPTERRIDTLILLAQAYRGAGERAAALRTGEQITVENPSYAPAWELLATMRSELGEHARAVSDAQTLVDVASAAARNNPADITVLQQLRAAIDTRIRILRTMTQSLYATGPGGQRIDRVLPGRERDVSSVMLQVIDALAQQREVESLLAKHELADIAAAAVQLDPQSPTALLRYATLMRATYRDAQAAEALQRLLEIEPGNIEAQRLLAEIGPLSTTPPAADNPTSSAPGP